MTDRIAMVTCGPSDHGISRFGSDLAAEATEQGFAGTILHEPDPHRLVDAVHRLDPGIRLVHLQANDWLFTDSLHRPEETIRSFAEALRTREIGLSLTLHDLPHPGVAPALFLRRARSYARMMAESVSVVVSSGHEKLLIAEAAEAIRIADVRGSARPDMPSVEVIPLPVDSRARPVPGRGAGASVATSNPTVGILGYLYPGKGHREVLHELSGSAHPLTVVALGRPSDGHEGMLPELTALGRGLEVDFRSTGFLPDEDLNAHLQAVSVPVAPAAQISASASINTWIAAGRRPLVVAGRYARELDSRMPGAVALYRPGELLERVEAALARPSLTHLPPGFRPVPNRQEAAARYLRWLRSIAARRAD